MMMNLGLLPLSGCVPRCFAPASWVYPFPRDFLVQRTSKTFLHVGVIVPASQHPFVLRNIQIIYVFDKTSPRRQKQRRCTESSAGEA